MLQQVLPYPALSELLNSSTPKSCQITPIGDRPHWHGQGTQMGWVARMGSAQSTVKESEGAQDLVQVCFTPFCSKKTCRKKSKRSVHLNSGCSTVGSPAAEMEGNGEPSQPVLVPVSKQGYRRGPGSRAKGEETTDAPAWLRWWQGASRPLCSA